MDGSGPPGSGAGRTALVVEDEPALRALTRQMLERNSYAVVEAQMAKAPSP